MIICKNLHALALAFALSFSVTADAVDLNLGGRAPSKQEVIRALKPSGGDEEISTRSIKIKPKKTTASQQNAISLEIRFEYDSAKLTGESIRKLTPVAEALTSGELESLKFQVEGYTDAKGSDAYNKNLSARRAAAVRNFFVKEYGLNASRIQASGYGESNLLDQTNPYSAANRRVRIVAMP